MFSTADSQYIGFLLQKMPRHLEGQAVPRPMKILFATLQFKVESAVKSDYLKDYPVNGKNQGGYVKKGSTDPISL
jgi:hypothetical protein